MIKLNEEICEFVGAFIGDGYLGNYGKRKNQFLIGFSGNKILDEDYLKNYLLPLIKRQFPYASPHLRYRSDENTLVLYIYSKRLFEFFTGIGFKSGIKARTVVIPECIEEDEKLLKATIRGIFDTDGCLYFDNRKTYKKPYPRIVIQVASIPLIKQLNKHLSKEFTLYVDTSNRDGKRNTLEIYGHQQLQRFLKLIGFSNKRHLSKIAPVAQR